MRDRADKYLHRENHLNNIFLCTTNYLHKSVCVSTIFLKYFLNSKLFADLGSILNCSFISVTRNLNKSQNGTMYKKNKPISRSAAIRPKPPIITIAHWKSVKTKYPIDVVLSLNGKSNGKISVVSPFNTK